MTLYKFIKDRQGWYVDLKNTPFTRTQLGMVRGADTILNIMAKRKKKVSVDARTSYKKGYGHLKRKRILNFGFSGADYILSSYKKKKLNHAVWLCPVTLWVFLRYPSNIYFKVV